MRRVEYREVVGSGNIVGSVERFHTWPTIRRQTVADHTWNVMRIFWKLFGPEAVTPEVFTVMLLHDGGEMGGDLLHQAKRDSPSLKEAADESEKKFLAMMLSNDEMETYSLAVEHLTPLDKARIKICDNLECLEFALVDRAMGNRLADPVIDAITTAVMKNEPNLTLRDWEAVQKYMKGLLGA